MIIHKTTIWTNDKISKIDLSDKVKPIVITKDQLNDGWSTIVISRKKLGETE